MDVFCKRCGASYAIDPSRFKNESLRVQCSSCGHIFRVYKPVAPLTQPVKPKDDKRWIIRYRGGSISIVPDQATLQRWIVEQRVRQEDELSHDEQHWTALGTIQDFQPFFSIVNQSKNINALPTSSPNVQPIYLSSGSLPAYDPTASPSAGMLNIQGERGHANTMEFGIHPNNQIFHPPRQTMDLRAPNPSLPISYQSSSHGEVTV
ncbi:MAG: zinc-ribbon domain-containing protein, partial [Myxococcota bacterium]